MEYLNHSSSNSSSISLKIQVSTGLLGVSFLLGVPANVAVVVFIIRHFKKDNFTLHLMLNLAASDILRLVIVPLWMYTLNFDWTLGRTLCKLMYLIAFTSAYSSVLTVTLMSVQRYVVVLHRSQWAKLGSKGEKVLLFSLWTLALILSSPAAVKADLTEGQNDVCRRTNDEETLDSSLCETLLGFVLPFCIVAMSYICLHKKVNQTTLFSNPRLTKLMIAIVLTFLILWIPFHVMNLVKILGIALKSSNPLVSKRLKSFCNSGHIVTKALTILNSCANPFLYACSPKRIFQT
ncbi:hypothetical protein ACEWY4_016046 [Coilia grayii]|uniref:G-protein coupled receptors family 1 profile domain-containing protein n=1 Tax=Coilia grayii TaxID=363190 RepID=A0ABD1JQL8_9TELE